MGRSPVASVRLRGHNLFLQRKGSLSTIVCNCRMAIFPQEERERFHGRGTVCSTSTRLCQQTQLYLFEADFINDRGDITDPALLTSGEVHQYSLLRCGERDRVGCSESGEHEGRPVRSSPSTAQRFTKNTIQRVDPDYFSHIRRGLRNVGPRSN